MRTSKNSAKANDKGSYVLLMKLDKEKEIQIGRKGPASFPGGYYCYVGSAMNSIEKRVCRHLSSEKTKRWHIDWFLDHAVVMDVKRIESENKEECDVSREIGDISDGIPMKGFGSSDCRICQAHLHFFEEDPSEDLEKVVSRWKSSKQTTRK